MDETIIDHKEQLLIQPKPSFSHNTVSWDPCLPDSLAFPVHEIFFSPLPLSPLPCLWCTVSCQTQPGQHTRRVCLYCCQGQPSPDLADHLAQSSIWSIIPCGQSFLSQSWFREQIHNCVNPLRDLRKAPKHERNYFYMIIVKYFIEKILFFYFSDFHHFGGNEYFKDSQFLEDLIMITFSYVIANFLFSFSLF